MQGHAGMDEQRAKHAVAIGQPAVVSRNGIRGNAIDEAIRAHAPASSASNRPRALARVSCSSASGCESATMPAPARNDTSPRCQTRSEEHTSELQSLMRISYAVFCLKKKTKNT